MVIDSGDSPNNLPIKGASKAPMADVINCIIKSFLRLAFNNLNRSFLYAKISSSFFFVIESKKFLCVKKNCVYVENQIF